ncbi:ABC transporter ATP-binding protein [Clostridium cadaveris]|uniref:ABC transporter ATP-binding protein n=1 Tax=Clostridium cadaveris TaxID=1529 RepID=UPI003993D222
MKKLNLNIEEGKITTIIGPNGSGKSTLLSLLCGINKSISGDILVNKKDIRKIKNKELAKIISTVHQQNSVPSDLTVYELVKYGRMPYKKAFEGFNDEDEEIIHWAIKSTGMEKFLDKEVMCLSGGERQRAFIAMALAQKTDILVLDEPTTYLDIYHQIQVLDIVKKLNKDNKTTVLMVLHDINQALQYSDNIIIMNEGKVIAQGRSEEVINCNIIKRVYGVNGIIKTDEDIKRSYFIPVESVCNM